MLGKDLRPVIVISAINIMDGGALSALNDCLTYLNNELSGKYRIIVLVHRADLFSYKNLEYIEFEKSKSSWFLRIYYEYYYFKKLSEELDPYLWLSMHDTTPNVTAKVRAVYCHNPAPFYKLNLQEIQYEPKLYLFNLFYKSLYKININKNNYIVVQQQWLREEFRKISDSPKIIVAHPEIDYNRDTAQPEIGVDGKTDPSLMNFFYPAYPRVFKNYEVICKAAEHLNNSGTLNFKVYLTIDGSETKYSKRIVEKYKMIPSLRFTGIIPREEVISLYSQTDCMIFPSKLETWGMPLSEFKLYQKPILASDLHYAKETIGDYVKVKFFTPDNHVQLAEFMKQMIEGTLTFDSNHSYESDKLFAKSWKGLFRILTLD